MTTITITKQRGLYVYDDYYKAKAILRIRELTDDNPAQNIYRSKSFTNVDAVLVKKSWYDTKSPAAPLPIEVEEVADDFLSVNLSNMVNIVLGRAETTALMKKMVDEGPAQTHYKVYAIIQTKEFFRDGSDIVPFEDTPAVKVGGNILAYLISPDLYIAIA
jgi:hypothetical protein